MTEAKEEMPISLRYATLADEAFIFATWLKSYRHSSFAKNIRSNVYYPEHHKVVEKLVKRSSLIVAVNPEDTSHIYGWLCFEKGKTLPILHYTFVKEIYRGFGIASSLLEAAEITGKFAYTHDTGARVERGLYCPYLILGG